MPKTTKAPFPPNVKTFGQAVRFLREKSGMTLRELATRTGLTAPFLSDIEHDRRRTDKVPAFAAALGVAETNLRELDGRLPSDLKEWLHTNPQVVSLLQELRDSGRPVDELRALFAKGHVRAAAR